MNRWILSAAILSGVLFLLHIIGGETEVHIPFLESDLSLEMKAYASIIWHAVSVFLLFNTGALLISARRSEFKLPLVSMVSAQYIAFAGLFIFYGLQRLGTIFAMPQWTFFLIIPLLAIIGLRKTNWQNPS